jgi:hypothetical protein
MLRLQRSVERPDRLELEPVHMNAALARLTALPMLRKDD